MKILRHYKRVFTALFAIALLSVGSYADLANGTLSLSGSGETFDSLDQIISTENGLVLSFSFSAWGTSYMSDGFTLALFDANTATPGIGGDGGSLAYANRSGSDGLAGGVLGIGFDAHGNFSAATEGRNGGTLNKISNSVSLRGSMGATRQEGYEYIAGTDSLSYFMNDHRAGTLEDALSRDVRITITTNELVSVEWKLSTEFDWTTLIDEADASEEMNLPDEIKVGVTSSLNDGMNVEISALGIPEPAVATLIILFGTSLLVGRRIFTK